MNLFDISQQYLKFCNDVENGEIPPKAISDTLEAITGEFHDKADNIACFIKALDYDAGCLEQEAKALMERARAKSSKAERLREYLLRQMQDTGIKRIESPRAVLSIKKNPPKLFVADEQELISWAQHNCRDDLLKFAAPSLNRKEITAQLKMDKQLPGCRLEQSTRLEIK